MITLTRTCPTCTGPGEFMGALGNTLYMRCRNCGLDYAAATLTPQDDAADLYEWLSDQPGEFENVTDYSR